MSFAGRSAFYRCTVWEYIMTSYAIDPGIFFSLRLQPSGLCMTFHFNLSRSLDVFIGERKSRLNKTGDCTIFIGCLLLLYRSFCKYSKVFLLLFFSWQLWCRFLFFFSGGDGGSCCSDGGGGWAWMWFAHTDAFMRVQWSLEIYCYC